MFFGTTPIVLRDATVLMAIEPDWSSTRMIADKGARNLQPSAVVNSKYEPFLVYETKIIMN